MDALVAAFVAALLGEWGDKTQLLLAALTARTGRPGLAFAGIALAVLGANVIAGFAGDSLVGVIPPRATGLLLALALLFAGLAAFWPRRLPETGSLRLPLFATAFILALAAQLAGGTPFLTFALAARFDAPLLAAAGASAGALAACLPAAAMGESFARTLPLRPVRMTAGVLFLIAGAATGLSALRLV